MKLKLFFHIVLLSFSLPIWAMKTVDVTASSKMDDQARMNLAQEFANKQQWISVFDIMYPMALEGNITAQSNLGMLYNLGRGTVRDYEKAYWWFSEAAEKGSVKGLNNLGVMYLRGDYVKQNTEQAIKLFERTARAKDTDAMMMLSNIYRSQNQPEKSLEWLKKAAELGNKEAKQRLSSQP